MKEHFPLLVNNPSLVYLDSAATTPLCSDAVQAMTDFDAHNYGAVHRTQYKLGTRATQSYEGARQKIANAFGVAASQCVLTRGTTHGLNMAIFGCEHLLQSGDEIVTSQAEHHALLVPLQELARKTGAILRFVNVVGPQADFDYEQFAQLVNQKTKLVALHHFSNVLGSIIDTSKIHQILLDKNVREQILLILDGAQRSSNPIPDFSKSFADVLCCGAHKLYGPTGIGAMLLSQKAATTLKPTQFGGAMIDEVTLEKTTYAKAPLCFEAGTPPVTQAIGFAAAIDFVQRIYEQNQDDAPAVSRDAYEQLFAFLYEHATVYGPKDVNVRTSVISFNMPGAQAYDVAALFDDYDIAVRSGHLCAQPLMKLLGTSSVIRVSVGLYTDQRDVDAFKEAYMKIKQVLVK